NDTLWSGTGNDFLELSRGANVGVDRVKDYTDGVDKFLLSDRFGLGSLEFTDLTISQQGNNAQIKITDNNQLLAIVENTNANQLNSNDFVTV
ncbi:MAG: calcium-binding protein, partial [Xenococcus sp. (in: cyanobacteria)]